MPDDQRYIAAESLEHALEVVGEYGEECSLLAGGQSLVPILNLGLLRPGVILDIDRLGGLGGIEVDDGLLRLGALARHRELVGSKLVRDRCSLLAEAAGLIGHPQIRNRGTLGGSLAHADPAAEYPAVMLALEARIVARDRAGERTIPAGDFFITYLTTALDKREILTQVEIPLLPARTGTSFQELTIREGDFAIVGACAVLMLDEQDRCVEARIALAGVEPIPVRARRAETVLKGSAPGDELLETAAATAADEVQPEDDVRASAGYRRKMTRVFVRRALASARARAKPAR
jgi:CO/xanthine dehydrogenase FAD-binding subunit